MDNWKTKIKKKQKKKRKKKKKNERLVFILIQPTNLLNTSF